MVMKKYEKSVDLMSLRLDDNLNKEVHSFFSQIEDVLGRCDPVLNLEVDPLLEYSEVLLVVLNVSLAHIADQLVQCFQVGKGYLLLYLHQNQVQSLGLCYLWLLWDCVAIFGSAEGPV